MPNSDGVCTTLEVNSSNRGLTFLLLQGIILSSTLNYHGFLRKEKGHEICSNPPNCPAQKPNLGIFTFLCSFDHFQPVYRNINKGNNISPRSCGVVKWDLL